MEAEALEHCDSRSRESSARTTLWCHQSHGWLGNPLEMEVLIGKSQTNAPFSVAMFDYRSA